MKGFANIRSSLEAVTARLYSRERANGCRVGSRLREMGAAVEEVEGK